MTNASKKKSARRGPGRTKNLPEEPVLSFDDVRAEAAAIAAISPKNREAEAAHQRQLLSEVEALTVGKVVQDLTTLGVGISDSLAKISSEMQEQVRLLETLREAVQTESDELSRLHRIDVALSAIDDLVRDYDERKAALQREMAEQRRFWDEDRASREKEQKEAEQALRRQRAREQEEYEYQKTFERKKAQDDFDAKLREQEKRIKERDDEVAKTWAARETELREREAELTNLRQEVMKFPERLKKEVDNAVQSTAAKLTAQHKQDMIVAQKDWEAERKVAALQIKTLTDAAERQLAQIEHLQGRLEDSKQQVQEIAVKAIEGASGARALSHVSQIAMEQARPRAPQP